LEYDHVHPAALGGAATVENGRLLCRAHQLISAEQTFGRAHLERCRRGSRKGESASSGGSAGTSGSVQSGQTADAMDCHTEASSISPVAQSYELLLFGREHAT
jgi:hypothetical protein